MYDPLDFIYISLKVNMALMTIRLHSFKCAKQIWTETQFELKLLKKQNLQV